MLQREKIHTCWSIFLIILRRRRCALMQLGQKHFHFLMFRSSYDPRDVYWSSGCGPRLLKAQEMCDKAVRMSSFSFLFVPDHFKTQEMCNKIVHTIPKAFHYIPDCFRIQGMCKKAIEKDPSMLKDVRDHFEVRLVCFWGRKKLNYFWPSDMLSLKMY